MNQAGGCILTMLDLAVCIRCSVTKVCLTKKKFANLFIIQNLIELLLIFCRGLNFCLSLMIR